MIKKYVVLGIEAKCNDCTVRVKGDFGLIPEISTIANESDRIIDYNFNDVIKFMKEHQKLTNHFFSITLTRIPFDKNNIQIEEK